jgi:hypothetical protein
MKKRLGFFFGWFLLAAPTAVQAQFGYLVNFDNTVTITNYTGSDGAVSIPATINNMTVTTIGNGENSVFSNTSATGVTLPANVTSIGGFAFAGPNHLTSVTLEDRLTNIGEFAFSQCGLTTIAIPGSVTSVGIAAFEDCGLTSVTIEEGVSYIEETEFYGCSNLTSVTIPNSVTDIGLEAFEDCGLTNVTIGQGVSNIENYAFEDCANLRSVFFAGNAPASGVGLGIFQTDSNNPTVYYLPGATGWSSLFGDRPSLQWNPTIQTGESSFGISNKLFGFNISGTTNIPIVVEACANLAVPVWTSLQALTLTNGLFYFSDSQSTIYPSRFYRIRSP